MLLGCLEPLLGMGIFMWMVLIVGFSKIHRLFEYPFPFKMNGEMGAHIP